MLSRLTWISAVRKSEREKKASSAGKDGDETSDGGGVRGERRREREQRCPERGGRSRRGENRLEVRRSSRRTERRMRERAEKTNTQRNADGRKEIGFY